jgi:hypothetical protein
MLNLGTPCPFELSILGSGPPGIPADHAESVAPVGPGWSRPWCGPPVLPDEVFAALILPALSIVIRFRSKLICILLRHGGFASFPV